MTDPKQSHFRQDIPTPVRITTQELDVGSWSLTW